MSFPLLAMNKLTAMVLVLGAASAGFAVAGFSNRWPSAPSAQPSSKSAEKFVPERVRVVERVITRNPEHPWDAASVQIKPPSEHPEHTRDIDPPSDEERRIYADSFFQSQNNILQSGIGLGLLPDIGDLNTLWIE